MNYMGTSNMNMTHSDNNGSFQPAARQFTPEQRMYMRNHPDTTVSWDNNYRHGCMNNSSNMNMNQTNGMMNNMYSNGTNSSGMMTAWPQNNNMLTTAPNGNTISLRPETMTNTDFLPAYLKQFIGRWVRCEFFIGDTVEQRVGVLHDVGASYIIIDVIEPQTLVVCDIFSLRFVTIVLDEEYGRLLRV